MHEHTITILYGKHNEEGKERLITELSPSKISSKFADVIFTGFPNIHALRSVMEG